MTRFQIISLFIFGFLGIAGVLAFSGLFDNRAATGIGSIEIWGTLPETQISNTFAQLQVNKTINFTVKYKGFSESEFDQSLIEALASGKGPDAIMLSQDLIAHYQDKIYAIPTSSYPARYIYDTFIDEAPVFISGQGIVGIPLVVDPMVAYWNKDMFSSAGIAVFPKTWDDLIKYVPSLTVKDARGGVSQSAVALGGYANITNAKDIISTLLLQSGETIATWTNDGSIQARLGDNAPGALSFYTQFSDPSKTVYTWNSALDSSRQMFEAGKLAVYFGHASEYDDIRQKNPHLNFDVAVMPQRALATAPAVYGKLYAFAVLQASPKKTNAFTAGSILSGSAVLQSIAVGARLAPARRDLLSAGTIDPVLTIFNRAALISKGWLDPSPSASDKVFRDALESMLSGQSKDNEAATYISGQLQRLMPKNATSQ
ncbi:MAG: extracellular solute-binding protein [Candidatus Paceibacterota bacterium]|jgi:ABC-type glycerol-3-phosphate transport system substrate-binding protein